VCDVDDAAPGDSLTDANSEHGSTLYVGLEVHNESITVAYLADLYHLSLMMANHIANSI
jgi:hypothetical protein